MGADKPKTEKTPEINKSPLSFLFIWTVVAFLGVALFQYADFSDEYEVPKLSPKEELKLQKRLKEIDDSEQYALVARMDDWYPCLHSGRTTCYLLAGEVWKYGVTSKGEFGRYKANFLLKNKVSYVTQFEGTFSECLKQEQIRLFSYPFLPENLARPQEERLPRPPYNSIMR